MDVKTSVLKISTLLLLLTVFWSGSINAAIPPREGLEKVRHEIQQLEDQLLSTNRNQVSAKTQLSRLRRLLYLQKQEISMSHNKIKQLTESLEELAAQKLKTIENINAKKDEIRSKLRTLNKLTDANVFDFTWLHDLESENQKVFFVKKTLEKNLNVIRQLKADVQAATDLEMRILEEKSKLDYYIQDLKEQRSLLSANEEVQKQILKTNRSQRMEALRRVSTLKHSEHELQEMLKKFDSQPQWEGPSLSSLKGKLLLPVDGDIITNFGRRYNQKTNLHTFQKGIQIRAIADSNVRAIASGKIVYSGPLKNYGMIVIVEHPGSYYSLYGQLGSVKLTTGNLVARREVLGTTNKKPFYFEIRKKNVAVNPVQWLLSKS